MQQHCLIYATFMLENLFLHTSVPCSRHMLHGSKLRASLWLIYHVLKPLMVLQVWGVLIGIGNETYTKHWNYVSEGVLVWEVRTNR